MIPITNLFDDDCSWVWTPRFSGFLALLSPRCCGSFADVRTTSVVVTNCQGDTAYERQTGVLNRKIIYPLKVVLSDPKRKNWRSRKCTLDATGLGGSDLPSQVKADITVRTDKHKQNIYGPSMTTVETVAKCHIWGRTVHGIGDLQGGPRVPSITLLRY